MPLGSGCIADAEVNVHAQSGVKLCGRVALLLAFADGGVGVAS
jgi:hypothetical protein